MACACPVAAWYLTVQSVWFTSFVCCRRQVCAEEAKEAYDAAIVHEVPSNTTDDMDSNVARATAWVQSWRASHK